MSLVGLDWYEGLSKWDGANFSPLKVPIAILGELGNPQDDFLSIHIAGTNGKGSVATCLESILLKSNKWDRVGKVISPHILSITEVASINGRDISLEELDRSLKAVKKIVERLGCKPTQYVALLVATFYWLQNQGVDLAIVEAGLGGRFDATNVLQNKLLNIITSIGLEHEVELGSSLKEIACHKAGIIKSDVTTVVGVVGSQALQEIEKNAQQFNSKVLVFGRDFVIDSGCLSIGENKIELKCNPIEPEYKINNQALSAVAATSLGVEQEEIQAGIRESNYIGRFDIYQNTAQSSSAIIDVAHNPDGVRELFSDQCKDYYKRFASLNIIIAVLKRKKWREMFDIINSQGDLDSHVTLFCMNEDTVSGDEVRESFPELSLKEIRSLERFNIENIGELNLFFGSTILYKPFISWAENQKLSQVSGHLA